MTVSSRSLSPPRAEIWCLGMGGKSSQVRRPVPVSRMRTSPLSAGLLTLSLKMTSTLHSSRWPLECLRSRENVSFAFTCRDLSTTTASMADRLRRSLVRVTSDLLASSSVVRAVSSRWRLRALSCKPAYFERRASSCGVGCIWCAPCEAVSNCARYRRIQCHLCTYPDQLGHPLDTDKGPLK